MIEKIRGRLDNYVGKEITIKYNLGRNKFEKYNAVITELYDNIFIVETENKSTKSFSYIDVLTQMIKINY